MFSLDTIIPQNDINEKQVNTGINNFFDDINLSKLLRKSNILKLKGASCTVVFQVIFQLIFSGKNLYQLLDSKSDSMPFGKDVVYDFLNSVSYNWRKFLLILSSTIIKNKLYPLTSKDRTNVLIFDDSLYSRARSKTVELLSRVHDHASGKYVKGFRMLTLAWSDGNSLIPVAFSLLSSRNKKPRLMVLMRLSTSELMVIKDVRRPLKKQLKPCLIFLKVPTNTHCQLIMSYLIVGFRIPRS